MTKQLSLSKKTIVVGITGGIACYKTCDVIRQLGTLGADIHVVMTSAAQNFMTPMTFQVLSKNPVHTKLFHPTEESGMGHIELANKADLVLIAPATANFMGKMANGICDDLLSTLVCATKAPLVMAPSMNVNMWENKIVQENVSKLQKYGVLFIGPASGSLACGWEGKGRMEEPDVIVKSVVEKLKN